MFLDIFTHFSFYRSCRPWGSHTTRAVSAVSSVMRALTECPSQWTRKIRSTVSKTITGEQHLLRVIYKEKRECGTWICVCVKLVEHDNEKTSRCRLTSEVTAQPLNVPVLQQDLVAAGQPSPSATCSRHMRSAFRDEGNKGEGEEITVQAGR